MGDIVLVPLLAITYLFSSEAVAGVIKNEIAKFSSLSKLKLSLCLTSIKEPTLLLKLIVGNLLFTLPNKEVPNCTLL